MPASSLKQLYVAKCMKDLDSQTKIELKGKKTNILITSAEKVFKAAETSDIERDEEKAYVQYTRFIELVLLLRKNKDFASHPEGKLLSRNAQTALARAEDLKASLLKRYTILQEANCLAENEKNEMISSLQNNRADVIVSPEQVSPEVEVPKTEDIPELSISCSKLFSLLNNQQCNIILMDTRPPKDFEESRIKHSQCINIPEHLLEPGTTAMKLEGCLPPDSLGKWYKRGDADHIILIDWDSKDETAPSFRLEVLKQAMSKWDQRCSLKKAPMILQGGYKDWMLKYPMYTTQALKFNSVNDFKASPGVVDVSGVEYPNLDEPDKSSSSNKENLNGPGVLFKKSNIPSPVPGSVPSLTNGRNSKSAPVVDRKSKPTIDRSSKTSVGERKNLQASNQSLKEDKNTSSGIPALTRTNSGKGSSGNNDQKELISSLSRESSLAKESLELAKQQLAKEQEFEKLRLQKELAAEESIRQEIQKREEHLSESLQKMEIESKDKDRLYLQLKEENLKLKRLLSEKNIKKEDDKEVQKQKEEIIEAEKQRKAMQEYVEKLREQRKKQEIINKRKAELSKTDVIPREVVSANTGLKRNLTDQNSQNSEYTVPLSRQSSTDSGGRGLVRSHSSPNIAQMVNQEESSQRKIPVVDRSLKPKVITPSHQVTEINRARLRNLNPVYGNPVRPATGLRNLGNTCFMNSIIQCLSNTIPLAEYFTSNQYMEDINRDSSKSGTGGEVAEEFAVVIKSLWMGQYKSFSPKDFKNTVSKCLAVCIGNEQQDSHEFFVVLMEKLHADLSKKPSRPIPKLESNADENAFWLHHRTTNSSRISELFEGLLKSTLKCTTCQTTSDSFEVFSCLSLPIFKNNSCSLANCFDHFLKAEKISGEAAWDCPKCKTKKEAEKRLRICRVPEILVIQLKRFSYEGLWRRKLQTTVNFDSQFDVPYEKNTDVYFRRYNLYGIVNHFGTLEGGHYTAFCSTSSNKWFKYDDHEVSEMSSSNVKTPAAYILFYRSSETHSNL